MITRTVWGKGISRHSLFFGSSTFVPRGYRSLRAVYVYGWFYFGAAKALSWNFDLRDGGPKAAGRRLGRARFASGEPNRA